MPASKIPGSTCTTWFHLPIDAGTLCRSASPTPQSLNGLILGNRPAGQPRRPAEKQYISVADLQPADIIVSTHDGFKQSVIRTVTDSIVGHALVYIGDGKIIEAVPPIAREVPLETSIEECTLVLAYRRKDMNDKQVATVISYLKEQVRKKVPYDTIGAGEGGARANLFLCLIVLGPPVCALTRYNAFDNPNRAYCSKLVLAAFEAADRPIIDVPPGVSNPNNIIEASAKGTLSYVGRLK